MKKVIMFPGQGSQYKGMGKELFGRYPTETKLASDILGFDIEELCVNNSNRQLLKTEYTQPAIYVVNSFLYREQNQVPDYLIGHSLGEYNALLEAGAFDFETGLRLVKKRGELMGSASGGGMAAVLGLNIKELKRKLAEDRYEDLNIANYNTPTQTVLSGTEESIKAVVKDFIAQGITIVPLFVSAPFHSRYMKPAEKEFSSFLLSFKFKELKIPVIANVTGRPYENHLIADLLSNQISRSVCWSDSIRYLMGQNVSEFQEVGKVMLTKMTTEICKSCTPIKEDVW
jgi:trans-AT polyketide synthase/acyltransferase/oxidoreductase domain-containing protein